MKRAVICFALVAVMLGASARALTPAELQRLLQSEPARELAFDEVRESPWLAAPVASRGTLHSNGQRLEKRITHPRVETWRLLPDRIEWVGAEASQRRQMRLADAPALATLASALRHVIAGEVQALERDFLLDLRGDVSGWTLLLNPRADSAARQIDHLELQGAGGQLQQIIVVERQGERTTTRIVR
jgi:hypothetical protein